MDKSYKNPRQRYADKSVLYNLMSRFYHYSYKHEKLRVTFELHDDTFYHWNGQEMEKRTYQSLDRLDEWTSESKEGLNKEGFRRVTGLYDSMIWAGVPVYLQIHGARCAQDRVRSETDNHGQLIYSQDTAATLHDFMQSKATQNFLRGMAKTQMSAMDTQKIIMIAILGAGVLFGLYIMGII